MTSNMERVLVALGLVLVLEAVATVVTFILLLSFVDTVERESAL